ncbi:hypothetical protein E2C01_020006 [Portunus trituberculatus]|uniref:Uncharacterized protein n=1 Tax=Portunus trituberculatus TaxID=210409 RepID=A0A5B7E0Y5_PORTR|nr:hypothetical protein [Portunus trituberculatus]
MQKRPGLSRWIVRLAKLLLIRASVLPLILPARGRSYPLWASAPMIPARPTLKSLETPQAQYRQKRTGHEN